MKTKKAARKTAQVTRQTQLYGNPSPVSTGNALERASEVLLLLQYPLSSMERCACWLLFEKRLERAYGGLGNG